MKTNLSQVSDIISKLHTSLQSTRKSEGLIQGRIESREGLIQGRIESRARVASENLSKISSLFVDFEDFLLSHKRPRKQEIIDIQCSRIVFDFYARLLKEEPFLFYTRSRLDGGAVSAGDHEAKLSGDHEAKLSSRGIIPQYTGINDNPKRFHETIREPLGVVGLITSFNYPLLLLSWKMAPALAAGNHVIVKPSHQDPESTVKLINLIHQHNIYSDDTVQVVVGDGAVGEAIIKDPRIKKISFTGSTMVGKRIAQLCSESLKPCTLELGGKNCAVVFADASIDLAVDSIVDGAFSNMGQNCCGISRLLVHSDIYDEFMVCLKKKTSRLVIGDPSLPQTDIGPIVDSQAYQRITNAIKEATKDENVTLWQLESASSDNEKDLIIPPTILEKVPLESSISSTELFGPVLCIHEPFDTIDEAIESVNYIANQTGYSLASGCFTTSHSTSDYFAQKVEAGMVWVNGWNENDPGVPFGGFNQSGIGKELGIEGLYAFTRQKSITRFKE